MACGNSCLRMTFHSFVTTSRGHPRSNTPYRPNRRGKTTLDRYVKGPFLLDPFTVALPCTKTAIGVFKLSTLAPTGFKESEYFRTWYRECGFTDECGILIQLNDGFMNLALGMTDSGHKFSKRHIDRLEVISPAIEALVRQQWREYTRYRRIRATRAPALRAGRLWFLGFDPTRAASHRTGFAGTQHSTGRRETGYFSRDREASQETCLRQTGNFFSG